MAVEPLSSEALKSLKSKTCAALAAGETASLFAKGATPSGLATGALPGLATLIAVTLSRIFADSRAPSAAGEKSLDLFAPPLPPLNTTGPFVVTTMSPGRKVGSDLTSIAALPAPSPPLQLQPSIRRSR